jgi:hypothetical protein
VGRDDRTFVEGARLDASFINDVLAALELSPVNEQRLDSHRLRLKLIPAQSEGFPDSGDTTDSQ